MADLVKLWGSTAVLRSYQSVAIVSLELRSLMIQSGGTEHKLLAQLKPSRVAVYSPDADMLCFFQMMVRGTSINCYNVVLSQTSHAVSSQLATATSKIPSVAHQVALVDTAPSPALAALVTQYDHLSCPMCSRAGLVAV